MTTAQIKALEKLTFTILEAWGINLHTEPGKRCLALVLEAIGDYHGGLLHDPIFDVNAANARIDNKIKNANLPS